MRNSQDSYRCSRHKTHIEDFSLFNPRKRRVLYNTRQTVRLYENNADRVARYPPRVYYYHVSAWYGVRYSTYATATAMFHSLITHTSHFCLVVYSFTVVERLRETN